VRLLPGSCPVPARFLPSGRFLPGSCPVPARFLPGSCPVPARFLPDGRAGSASVGRFLRRSRAQQPAAHHSRVLHSTLVRMAWRMLMTL
jgi:hypothetical protein